MFISQYRKVAHSSVTHGRRQEFYALPDSHRHILTESAVNLLEVFDSVDAAIDANADLAEQILAGAMEYFAEPLRSSSHENPNDTEPWLGTAKAHHVDKARSTIRQMFRDWSEEGAAEREACYAPVLEDLDIHFVNTVNKNAIKVLVPGAGLARLVFEICLRGYQVQGNEISWHQMIASYWVLNNCEEEKSFTIFPFATEFSNHFARESQLQGVKVPDVHPGTELDKASEDDTIPCSERLSMTAGDFIGIYSKEDKSMTYDAVVTVFFIDTAPNLIRYVETARNCLKRGGVWINLGPLLWHFEGRSPVKFDEDENLSNHKKHAGGIEEPGSFELTDEEVRKLVESMGFAIKPQQFTGDEAGYIHNPDSMMQSIYRVSHWVAVRVV